jgi:DNA polymerase-3 subunit alpha
MTILLQLAKPKKAKLTMTNVKDAEFVKCMPSGYQELVDYHFEMKEAGSAKGKEYNAKVKPLKEWLKTEEAINIESSLRRNAYAKERCPGSPEQWEFEALNLYLGKHWVSTCGVVMDDWKSAPIVDFGQKYDKVNIAGTIIGYNNNKRTVTLQTINGDVVIVKIQAKLWNKFSEETKNNPSWFVKGSSLVMFVMKRGNNSAFLQASFGDREAVIGKVIGRGNIRYEK